jgi:UDP-glucose 4-epimerase
MLSEGGFPEAKRLDRIPDIVSGKSVMVTGGAGFIGSNLGEIISADPANTVILVDDLSLGKRGNLAWIQGRSNCSFLRADVCDADAMGRAMEDVEIVLHQAGIPGVQASLQDPVGTSRANVEGTLSCLKAAADVGVKSFVLASSSAVYGDAAEPPVSELAPPAPISPYGASKLAAEGYCQVFSRLYGLGAVSLRYFNAYGPRQDPRSEYAAVIPRFVAMMLSGRRPTVYGDGEQTRDFVYVADIARANCMAAGAGEGCYNVGSGRPTSINRLVEILARETGMDLAPEYLPARPGDILHSWADTSLIRERLGFEPSFGLAEGLKQTIGRFESD